MGKTKIKTIDDSAIEPASAKATAGKEKPAKKLGRADEPRQTTQPAHGKRDELVEKLKAELGVEEEKLDVRSEKVDKEVRSLKLEDQTSNVQPPKPTSNIKHPTSKPKPRSKKYQEVTKDLDKTKTYPIDEAIDLVKKLSYSQFNGTLEAHINTQQTGIRGLVTLPFSVGKELKIVAFGKGAEGSGADVAGDDSIINEISKGKINFDLVITTAEWMPKLAKVAKNLGPKGLMPNPKAGTITDDLKKAVESFREGKTEYETESKAPVIHLALGKLDQPSEELSSNVKTLLSTLGKSRIKKVTLSPTMGPSVRIDLASI